VQPQAICDEGAGPHLERLRRGHLEPKPRRRDPLQVPGVGVEGEDLGERALDPLGPFEHVDARHCHADPARRSRSAIRPISVEASRIRGSSIGGILVIIGIIVMIVWSFWVGLIVLLIGLIAFGGFARGKWY
jgi:hypothetical protein